MEDLLKINFSLKSDYIKSHFNRLAKNNRYLGPDQTKTWRNLLNIHPTSTSHPVPSHPPVSDSIAAPASTTTDQSSSDLPTEQILPSTTRSGRIYSAAIQTTTQEDLISVTQLQHDSSNSDNYSHAVKKGILKKCENVISATTVSPPAPQIKPAPKKVKFNSIVNSRNESFNAKYNVPNIEILLQYAKLLTVGLLPWISAVMNYSQCKISSLLEAINP